MWIYHFYYQLLTALNSWVEALEKDTRFILTLHAEVFDSVPHVSLLTKLESYGVAGNVLRWLKSFLLGRKLNKRL